MKKAAFRVLSFFVLTAFSAAAYGQAPIDKDKNEFLEATLSAVSRVERISSDFVQERHLSMLTKGIVVMGHFYYEKPDHLRWEQKEPAAGGFIVKGSSVKRWDEKGKVETTSLTKDPSFGLFVNQVFAWCKGDAGWLKERYEIRMIDRSPPTVRLVPLTKAERRYLDHLTITFSEDRTYVRTVDIETADKDVITTSFVNTEIDPPFTEDLFEK